MLFDCGVVEILDVDILSLSLGKSEIVTVHRSGDAHCTRSFVDPLGQIAQVLGADCRRNHRGIPRCQA